MEKIAAGLRDAAEATKLVNACVGHALGILKEQIDTRLNNRLVEMKPDYDDSITGFNEAWDIVRAAFAEVATDTLQDQPPTGRAPQREWSETKKDYGL